MTTPEPRPRNPWRRLSLNQQRFAGAILGLTVAAVIIAFNSGDDEPDNRTIRDLSAASPPAGGSLDLDRCGTNRDVLVWNLVPDRPATADRLGEHDVRTCQTTFEYLREISDTGPGFCTEAAYASDNPGYDESVRPAPRLRVVQVSIGLGCG